MPKDIIPTDRGLSDDEIGKPFPKQPTKPDLSKDDSGNTVQKIELEIIPESKNPGDFKKIVEFGKGLLVVVKNDGKKIKLTGGSLSWRNNNPGNIRYSDFAKRMGALGEGHNGMAIFKNYEDGLAAQKELLFGPTSKYVNLNLLDAIRRYAPDYDNNNSKEYANFVSNTAKINKTTTLAKLTSKQRTDMIKAMSKMEGFKEGQIEEI